MRVGFAATLAGLALAACAAEPQQQTAWLPPGVFGVYQDNDIGAINQAAWAFASPANTRANPVTAINAVIALEYLSGELRQNPRWVGMDGGIKVRMRQARDEVRQVLGIRADAPAQMVVNTLLWTATYLRGGDVAAALHMLGAPIFTRAPEEMLRLLSNMPYVQTANLATSRAEDESFPPGGARG